MDTLKLRLWRLLSDPEQARLISGLNRFGKLHTSFTLPSLEGKSRTSSKCRYMKPSYILRMPEQRVLLFLPHIEAISWLDTNEILLMGRICPLLGTIMHLQSKILSVPIWTSMVERSLRLNNSLFKCKPFDSLINQVW